MMRKVAGVNRRVTLVRGAGAGTGSATAHGLATGGYLLALIDLDASGAAQAVADLGSDQIAVPGDVANEEDAEPFVVKTVARGYLAYDTPLDICESRLDLAKDTPRRSTDNALPTQGSKRRALT